jgi:hypothetical protein
VVFQGGLWLGEDMVSASICSVLEMRYPVVSRSVIKRMCENQGGL